MSFGAFVKVEDNKESIENSIRQILYYQSIGAGLVIDTSSLSSDEKRNDFMNELKCKVTQYNNKTKRQVN